MKHHDLLWLYSKTILGKKKDSIQSKDMNTFRAKVKPFKIVLDGVLPNKNLIKKVTPDFAIGCKRVLFTDDFLPTLADKPQVRLITEGISNITENRHIAALYRTHISGRMAKRVWD